MVMTAGSKQDRHMGKSGGEGQWNAARIHRRMLDWQPIKGDGGMTKEARSKWADPVAAQPLSELLACPSETGSVLTASVRTLAFDAGQTIFRQGSKCEGLYLVVQGQQLRRTDRLDTRITLGMARPGDLVELAAALGEPKHTYSLVAQTQSLLMQFPLEGLLQAFEGYPPLRMRLLEELAREVSRAYILCSQAWWGRTRRGGSRTPA
jgi:Cyclic nucleotide-binding domain